MVRRTVKLLMNIMSQSLAALKWWKVKRAYLNFQQ